MHHRNQQAAEHGLPARNARRSTARAGCRARRPYCRRRRCPSPRPDIAADTSGSPAARRRRRRRRRCRARDRRSRSRACCRARSARPSTVAAITTSCARMPVRLAPIMIGEDAHRHPQQRAGQHRDRDQRELLVDREVHVARDVDDQRAERDPGHETDVEVEERGQQCRPMTCLLEFSELHCDSLAIMPPIPCAQQRQVSAQTDGMWVKARVVLVIETVSIGVEGSNIRAIRSRARTSPVIAKRCRFSVGRAEEIGSAAAGSKSRHSNAQDGVFLCGAHASLYLRQPQ